MPVGTRFSHHYSSETYIFVPAAQQADQGWVLGFKVLFFQGKGARFGLGLGKKGALNPQMRRLTQLWQGLAFHDNSSFLGSRTCPQILSILASGIRSVRHAACLL